MRFLLAALTLAAQEPQAFFRSYCAGCHNSRLKTGPAVMEAVVARLRAESMPPPGNPRPTREVYRSVARALEADLDRAAPRPGRIGAVHRLTRVEYANAIRDLFGLDLDVRDQLPGDETADGSFDNFADSLTLSTAHLERYLTVARQVARLAVGVAPERPITERFDIPLHVLQNDRQSEDLPLGSRGGIAVRKHFAVDGNYTLRVRLQRQYQDYLKGMGWPQSLDVRVDGKLVKRFPVGGAGKGRPAAASYAGDGELGFAGDPEWERYMQVDGDAALSITVPIAAGARVIGVSFVREQWESEGLPQPQQRGRVIANDQVYMGHANVAAVFVSGPFQTKPSAERITTADLPRLARLAYRRPVTTADIAMLTRFQKQGGMAFAIERMLVDPEFLLRVYREPAAPGVYRISELELASRLSFFLWASIPDDRLLQLAERGELTKSLDSEVSRMLNDKRSSRALVDVFAAQWLNLRRVPEVVVDPIRYPNFDLTLLHSFRRETELFVESTLREDRDVRTLLNADYTFVNERLARHYGISGVSGSRFRRVQLPDTSQRGGLLAHGALLAATSYPDRTSPVLRGKWLLNNIIGLPVPPPTAGLDTTLKPNSATRPSTIRERLAQHRTDPACNSCHSAIDPLGFALENFDVIGGWRTRDELGRDVDTTPGGLAGLRAELLSDPEQFPRAFTEKLLAYALGRRIEYFDKPTVRIIVRNAAAREYKWSAIVQGIVNSPAFLKRESKAN